ncbi:MAG: pyridoxamine kinase [Clostridia bacterium]|nr:pyridoxamine kinase [Clostridia bacterium]
MKKIAAIHDMSCFGRCALTVIIPILSAMGNQIVPIPTALLSTHTGGFEHPYFHDLSDDMEKIVAHLDALGVKFDAIYSGFLGSARQIAIVEDIIDRFGGSCPVLVDPVMGDDGKLYSTYTDELVRGMARLCRRADIITPNLTEARFLTGMDIPEHIPDFASAQALALELCCRMRRELGVDKIVITGIHFGEQIGNAVMVDGEVRLLSSSRLPRSFPGTGEVFTSTLLGEIVSGASLFEAADFAAEFTYKVIKHSQNSPEPTRNGVLLEDCLSHLCDRQ